ncbi:ABC transporter ATP-binding protein [Granulosicoccus antarcticus]|uniref:Glutathione import ATP-binding protein GsiA n=1 Tax=Granulosicoccus antarcticus IMCC3135 TaxID=1192854 RepID=A0A2Z2NP67_9GAMM|nr:ABC transporter ATP-binding protein [Granulosicoccus antarcticus]ASJ73053.1 Glutathione import ATP-binding protein GsiA [Granulosicoccus antarcticus IMCC3135]
MNTPNSEVLTIRDLRVSFTTNDGVIEAVKGVDVSIRPGECLGVVGESGSGKSQTFLAAMGLLASNARVSGEVRFAGQNLLQLSVRELNRIRGSRISMIFQDPLTALTPHLRIGEQMREVLQTHQSLSNREAHKECLRWLENVRMPEAAQRLRQYPHELSGGMRQRVMIAMAMLCEPDLLIADEPTTALDVTIQAEILDLMDELRRDHDTAVVLITHDMGVVARMCDQIQVMRDGEYVEQGSCEDVFYRPQDDYTKMLLEAVPRIALPDNEPVGEATHQLADQPASQLTEEPTGKSVGEAETSAVADSVLKVRDLRVSFAVGTSWFGKSRELRAVDGIGFDLAPGETLGIVGESGSGKSTLARAILQLIKPTSGQVSWLGDELTTMSREQVRAFRQDAQIVFQDPLASLNPSMTIGDSIIEPLRVCEPGLDRAARSRRAADMMERVGLPYTLINRYPHELSGGQNQRVGIARAMISKPRLLICDEAVSALDVSIQAQIMELLKDLQREFGLSLIFISHDLSVVWEVSQRVLVMYLGSVVELAPRDQLFARPQHPYTRQLVSAVPVPDPRIERSRQRIKLVGEMASPMDTGARLRFLPSRRGQLPADYVPALQELSPGHFVAEHDPVETLLRL